MTRREAVMELRRGGWEAVAEDVVEGKPADVVLRRLREIGEGESDAHYIVAAISEDDDGKVQAARWKHLERLRDYYMGDEAVPGAGDGLDSTEDVPHRYVLVIEDQGERGRFGMEDWETEEEAFASAGDHVLEGWAPYGVFDLNTGTLIEVHISTPVVSRAEDQGMTINPLETPAKA